MFSMKRVSRTIEARRRPMPLAVMAVPAPPVADCRRAARTGATCRLCDSRHALAA